MALPFKPVHLTDWTHEYWSQGFVVIRQALEAEDIEGLSRCFNEIAGPRYAGNTRPHPWSEMRFIEINGQSALKLIKWPAAFHAGLNRYRLCPPLIDAVKRLLGDNLRQVVNQLHYKRPGESVSFQMHQDCVFRRPANEYYNLYHTFVQSALAVDACYIENGCIWVYPGSHLGEKEFDLGGYGEWDVNNNNASVLERLGEAVPVLLEPGDILLWNPYLVHGSPPNQSPYSRRVYINGFASTESTNHGIEIMQAGKLLSLDPRQTPIWDQAQNPSKSMGD